MKKKSEANLILKDLELVSILSYQLFLFDEENKGNLNAALVAQERALAWMDCSTSMLFNKTPREAILINQGEFLINFLKSKLGQ